MFNKKEENQIFSTLCDHMVPMVRAAWYLKMTAAISATMAETKTMKRRAPIDPSQGKLCVVFLGLFASCDHMVLIVRTALYLTAALCAAMAETKIMKRRIPGRVVLSIYPHPCTRGQKKQEKKKLLCHQLNTLFGSIFSPLRILSSPV